MGKASSSKKVARAAGTGGGRTNRGSTPWTFVGLIALIAIVGVALTFTSRNRTEVLRVAASNSNAKVPPLVGGTPWNEGLGVYICNAFVPAIKAPSNPEGLTTDGNGIIHIAPKVKTAAGKNATLTAFAKAIGMTLSGSELQLPGGKKYANGDDCGGKAAKLYIKQYPYVGAVVGTVATADPTTIRLVDKALLTIAFVPSSDKSKIPAPPSYVQANLRKIDTPATPATTTTSTVPSSTTTTKGSTTTATTGSAAGSASSATTSGSSATTSGSSATTSGSSATTSGSSTSKPGSSTTKP